MLSGVWSVCLLAYEAPKRPSFAPWRSARARIVAGCRTVGSCGGGRGTGMRRGASTHGSLEALEELVVRHHLAPVGELNEALERIQGALLDVLGAIRGALNHQVQAAVL